MKTEMNAGRLCWNRTLLHVAVATLCFHLAYSVPHLSVAMVGYLYGLIQLARAETWRRAFYPGLLVGLLTAGPQLQFFRVIFGGGAAALWLIVALWIGLYPKPIFDVIRKPSEKIVAIVGAPTAEAPAMAQKAEAAGAAEAARP